MKSKSKLRIGKSRGGRAKGSRKYGGKFYKFIGGGLKSDCVAEGDRLKEQGYSIRIIRVKPQVFYKGGHLITGSYKLYARK